MSKKILSINGQFLAINDSLIAMPEMNLQDKTVIPTSESQVIVSDTGYDGLSSVIVEGDANLIPENIAKDATIFGVVGTHEGGPDVSNVTVTESDVLAPKVFIDNEGVERVGTIPTQEAQIIVPSTSDIILSSGLYLGGSQTIKGDANLIPENIAKDIAIFGVVGTHAGSELNFTVVGGMAQPTNPKDGTVWVKTEDEISAWVFSAETPMEQEGLVWIEIGISSPIAFNALKKNTLRVYPQSCAQFIGGEWVNKDFMIAFDGQFESSTRYILTEGISNKTFVMSGNGTSGSSLPYLWARSGTAAWSTRSYYYYPDPIDLTPYKTIYFIGKGGNSGGWGESSAWYIGTSPTTITASIDMTSQTSEVTKTMDVSSLTGEYYIGMTPCSKHLDYDGSVKSAWVYGRTIYLEP